MSSCSGCGAPLEITERAIVRAAAEFVNTFGVVPPEGYLFMCDWCYPLILANRGISNRPNDS